MTCPTNDDLTLASMDLLDESQADQLRTHLEECEICRRRYQEARRGHVELLRTYEALDRDHDGQREQLMASLPGHSPQSAPAGWRMPLRRRLGGLMMSLNSPTGRRTAAILAPAACLAIAVVMFFGLTEKSAFASAIEHLKQAKTIVCRIDLPGGTQIQGMEITANGKMYVSDEYGSYTEMYANGMLVQRQYTPLEGPSLMVSPVSGSYFELDLGTFATTPDETVARTPAAWIQQLKGLEAKAGTELGTEIIDGHQTIGYRIDGAALGFPPPAEKEAPGAYLELWVDQESELPVQMKTVAPMTGFDQPIVVVLDQFEWNVPIEPACSSRTFPTTSSS